MTFRERWLTAVEKKNSVLCAGLDPAEFGMGRGENGLPKEVSKGEWALRYVEAVAPFCAAVKPNFQYWKNIGDVWTLRQIKDLAHELGMVVIDDSKLADIGDTNYAGIFYAVQRADAVTFSPFAGNLEEAVGQAHARGIGLISMVLMSNPEFEREKTKLVEIITEGEWREKDLIKIGKLDYVPFVPQYLQLARDAQDFGVDGIVIGAPSPKNHIKDEEIAAIRNYYGGLVLLPGVGAQGGEAGAIWKHFGRANVIVNVGRALMFPSGSGSSHKEQAETAKKYQIMLNELRTA
jgi:orotidine-5'-phosphate decarboxylase